MTSQNRVLHKYQIYNRSGITSLIIYVASLRVVFLRGMELRNNNKKKMYRLLVFIFMLIIQIYKKC